MACGAKGNNFCMRKLLVAHGTEEFHVLLVGTRKAPFDIVDPELIESFGET